MTCTTMLRWGRAALFVLLATAAAHSGQATIDVGRGPVTVHIPADYDGRTPTPLVFLLHGYMATGASIDADLEIGTLVDEYGFLYLTPDGETDAFNNQYWTATDACCSYFGDDLDDASYLRALIDEMKLQYNVDDRRVYLIGHSNGGFMAYEMACQHSEVIAAIVSVAGATHLNPRDCLPSEPVNVLQIHGTNDNVINYNGGCIFIFTNCYPSAMETVGTWAMYNGCSGSSIMPPDMRDLLANIPGEETMVERFTDGCGAGGTVELWTMLGGPHSLTVSPTFASQVLDYLYDHPKPPTGDLNSDGMVNQIDLGILLAAFLISSAGDLDGDGQTTQSDLGILLANFGQK